MPEEVKPIGVQFTEKVREIFQQTTCIPLMNVLDKLEDETKEALKRAETLKEMKEIVQIADSTVIAIENISGLCKIREPEEEKLYEKPETTINKLRKKERVIKTEEEIKSSE